MRGQCKIEKRVIFGFIVEKIEHGSSFAHATLTAWLTQAPFSHYPTKRMAKIDAAKVGKADRHRVGDAAH